MQNQKRFNQISRNIKEIKIQGATNVAKFALEAYSLYPKKQTKIKLLKLRPTEPMLENVLKLTDKLSKQQILNHFSEAQEKINSAVFRLIKNNDIIFTHCHSTNVVNSLIYAKRKGKKFEVYNTETRPLFQGRQTALELKKAGIKVTMFVDSAAAIAIEKQSRNDKNYADKIFLGADALLKNGIINKIGSGIIAELAYRHKIPLYIVADSWKFTKSKIPIENRKLNEVWDKAPKNIRMQNPAFEFVDKKYISGIVSEFGLMKYGKFVRKVS